MGTRAISSVFLEGGGNAADRPSTAAKVKSNLSNSKPLLLPWSFHNLQEGQRLWILPMAAIQKILIGPLKHKRQWWLFSRRFTSFETQASNFHMKNFWGRLSDREIFLAFRALSTCTMYFVIQNLVYILFSSIHVIIWTLQNQAYNPYNVILIRNKRK